MWTSCSIFHKLAAKKSQWKITRILKYAFSLTERLFLEGFYYSLLSSATNLATYLRSSKQKNLKRCTSCKCDKKRIQCLYNESWLTFSAACPPTLWRIHYTDIKYIQTQKTFCAFCLHRSAVSKGNCTRYLCCLIALQSEGKIKILSLLWY